MSDSTNSTAEKNTSPKRKRMDRDEREALIVQEAVQFFAEVGFEGKTRDLAARIGITQPLLYRYFPSKDSLIERVYQEVYVSRWNPAWETLIRDRSQPLTNRLTRFYQEYADAIYDYVWVRIFVFSGLKGVDINDRYLAMVREKWLEPVCIELRAEFHLNEPQTTPITDQEIELAWSLHGMFFYRAIRHFVYGLPMIDDPKTAIRNDVEAFIHGAPQAITQILTAQS